MRNPGRVLVTGASGFVGGHVAERFRSLGWDVVGVGRRSVDQPGYLRLDLAMTLPLDAMGRFDVVVHAAARASPWGTRREFEIDNVRATRLLLEACERSGRPRFVFISSSSVHYRACHQFNIREDSPLPWPAINTYAATKRRAERLIAGYSGEWCVLRPRAVFGPGDTVLLPRILAAAKAGRLPLLQADVPVIGDLIYIDNLVDAIVRAAVDPAVRGTMNLTNNEPVEILPFLVDILRQLNIAPPTRRVPVASAMRMAGLVELAYSLLAPRVEPPVTRFGVHVFAYSKTFEVSKMLGMIGRPRVSIAEGVERTIASVRDV